MFRHMPGCMSFYEPCNDLLVTHVEHETKALPTHRKVASYWDEYQPILDEARARHSMDFGLTRLSLEPQDEHAALERYLRFLLEAAGAKRPVLQFNRVDFRLGWLRRRFPEARILHLTRNSRDIWYSMVRDLPENGWKDAQANTNYDLVLWSLSLYHAFPFLFSPLVSTSYHRHYLLWRLSGLAGERMADLTLDFDRDVLGDTAATVLRLAEFAGQQDVPVDEIAGLVIAPERGRWADLADEQWFAAAEAECDVLLGSLGLLEHFGHLPLAEIESSHSAEWACVRADSVEAMSFAAARLLGIFREKWLRIGLDGECYVFSSEIECQRLRRRRSMALRYAVRQRKALRGEKAENKIIQEQLAQTQILLAGCEARLAKELAARKAN
jgi:hypothetical protein